MGRIACGGTTKNDGVSTETKVGIIAKKPIDVPALRATGTATIEFLDAQLAGTRLYSYQSNEECRERNEHRRREL